MTIKEKVMEINEIVELDLLADSIEQQAIEKGYSDSDQHRWKVAEEVTRRLEAGYSTRKLAGLMSNEGKKYDPTWISRQRIVWTNFGGSNTRSGVVYNTLHHFEAYMSLVNYISDSSCWDEVFKESEETGLSIATIAKRKAGEIAKAKRDEEQRIREEEERKKKEKKEKRREQIQNNFNNKPKPDPVVEDTSKQIDDESIVKMWDTEIKGIRMMALNLIDRATELTEMEARIDVRLTINQKIDDLINILNNAKLIVSGMEWNSV